MFFTIALLNLASVSNVSAQYLSKLKLNTKQENTLTVSPDKFKTSPRISNNFFESGLKNSLDVNHKKIKDNSFFADINPKLFLKNDYVPYESKKRFGTAAWEMGVVEFIPWAMAKYISKPGWANVGFQSWWQNIEKGWVYDGDNFLTNNFAHPYHGNLYFNTARTNGYNFWESIPFSFAGSLLWEYFGEYYRPSINDWINTSVSGFNLGEMTYRVSSMITDNTATGSSRMWKEIFGALINPVRGFNRLLSGETHRIFPNNPDLKTPEFTLSVNGGMRRITKMGSDILDSGVQEGVLGFDLRYGTLIDNKFSVPFSAFAVWGLLSNGDSKLSDLHSYGLLHGWKLQESKKRKRVLGLLVAYDFMSNPAFEFGGPSILLDLESRNRLNKDLNLNYAIAGQFILMGSTPTEYFYGEDGRDYDFGPGVGFRLNAGISGKDWTYGQLSYVQNRIFTQSGTPESSHLLHFFTLRGQLPVNNYFALGIDLGVYWRHSYYTFEDDVKRTSPIARLFFTTKL